MNELIFFLMLVIKELMEFVAIKRRQLHLVTVRGLLILSCLMLLHLIWQGALNEWSQLLRTLFIVNLISDIIILCSKGLISARGGKKI